MPYFNPGLAAKNPFIIIALALDRTLGDFAARLIFAASTKLLFEHARLFVYYRDDRPYKNDLIKLVPQIDGSLKATGTNASALDFFDIAAHRPIATPNHWIENDLVRPNLVLTPSMMDPNRIPSFDNRASLRIPDKLCEGYGKILVDRGLDPDKWFAVIHYREPTYEYRPPRGMRDVDPKDFLALRDFIIDELGGQVVRLGHTGMTPFPDRAGFVDLSDAPEGFMLQAFAISRARFAELTPSGPASICSAFDTPVGQTNTVEWFAIFNEHDLILPKHIITKDDQRISLDLMRRRSLLTEQRMDHLVEKYGCRIEPNTREELFEVARLLHASTSGCDGWRSQPPIKVPVDPPNQISWPIPTIVKNRYIELPEFAPPYPVWNG